VEARTLYVRGRYLLDRQSEESLHRGLACFREAVEIAPDYAAAWAGVADAYDLLSQFGFMAPVDGMAEARRAANKALSLDPSLAEAHIAMAAVLEAYDWNWKGAEREYKRAIELNPSLAGAHAWYGMFLRDRGRVKEAIPELELAYRLDPVSMITLVNLSTAYAMNGDLQSAIRHVKICVEIEPLSPKPMLMLAALYRKSKQDDMARQTFERAREMMGHNPHGLSSIAAVYASTGRKAEAEKVLEQVRGMARVRYVSPYDIAMVYMAMQQYDQAVPYLEAAYRERSTGMIFLCERKYSEAYRASRRFRELLSRLRLDG
jgi:tetratricopeptide (TPR) repeat protein